MKRHRQATAPPGLPRSADDSALSVGDPATSMPETMEGRRHRDAAVRRFLAHRPAVGSLIILLVLVTLTASAGVLPLSDPTAGDPYHQDSLPTAVHLLGTDDAGHDLLSALIFGLRPALAVGVAGQVVATLVGLLIGVVAGVYGGWVAALLSRLTDVVFALPTFLLAFLAVAVMGPWCDQFFGGAGRLVLIALVCGVVGWPMLMRFVRGLTLSVRAQLYVEAARALGASRGQIIRWHILPQLGGLVLVQATLGVGSFIYIETALSLLGLGLPPPTPDLGALVTAGAFHFDINPLEAGAPAVLLGVLLVALAFVGDGLRDALDPRSGS